jgi:hypothetical protein
MTHHCGAVTVMCDLAILQDLAMTTIGQPSEIAYASALNADPELPSAAQKAKFGTALAAAQDGGTGSVASGTADGAPEEEDLRHLVLYSMLQESVMRAMDDIDRNRKAAADSDD